MEKTCRHCLKANQKLFLKGDRCLSLKCALTRKAAPTGKAVPGRRMKKSEYGLQLLEKQKAKTEYGLRERQFRTYFEKAVRSKGNTGEEILKSLETRLDNVVYRLGWAKSRPQARQLVNHGAIKVNGRVVDIPSFTVKVKDEIEPAKPDQIKKIAPEKPTVPAWLKAEKNLKAQVAALPTREQIDSSIEEQLIVEFYSR